MLAYQLIGQQKHRLEGEFAVAKVEQILQAGTQQVQDHGIVIAFGTKPANEGNADTSGKRLVDSCFVFELRMLRLDGLELDRNLFSGDDVGSYKAKVSTTAWLLVSGPRGCFTDQGKYHRRNRCQSSGRCGTYYRPVNPTAVSARAPYAMRRVASAWLSMVVKRARIDFGGKFVVPWSPSFL